ncbi:MULTISPECIES: VOC family protein [unclassified Polaribacter]|uniref:VOC family protein n=1 Tax=unclassified Polaribacter TaxID=196858 RepID=UPI0011BD646C|nr:MULTISPECIES: VOC family protein [unclassified Polaribacter]TXD52112.1 VOC family protein [Polaribacter sp. IC063]TXD59966.1 VOC family protein [Polaribacter sp. IC066]
MGDVRPGKRIKKTEKTENYISWFEIPAMDFKEAVEFYQYIFGITMQQHVTASNAMAYFPMTTGIGGAVVSGSGYVPSDSGSLIYLNAGDNLSVVLDKVEPAGGRIIMPKSLISIESGYFAVFIDSQGNKLALHSKN